MRKSFIQYFNKAAQKSYLLNLKNKVAFDDMVKTLRNKHDLTKNFLTIIAYEFEKKE